MVLKEPLSTKGNLQYILWLMDADRVFTLWITLRLSVFPSVRVDNICNKVCTWAILTYFSPSLLQVENQHHTAQQKPSSRHLWGHLELHVHIFLLLKYNIFSSRHAGGKKVFRQEQFHLIGVWGAVCEKVTSMEIRWSHKTNTQNTVSIKICKNWTKEKVRKQQRPW